MRQASLLDRNNFPVLVFGKGVDMSDRADSGGNQPRKSKYTVDTNRNPDQDSIPIVRISVGELIGRMVDQVPCDTIIKEHKDESEHGWDSSKKGDP